MAETKEYRLTRGKHWEKDPERPGHLRRRVAGETVSLTENQAKQLADRIEPMGGAKPKAAAAPKKKAAAKKRGGKKKAG